MPRPAPPPSPQIRGRNFGVPNATESPAILHAVTVGSVSCTVTWLGDDQLVCSLTGSFVVGRVLVTVVVDGVPGSGGVVDMQCPAKYHGGRGEECQPCPAGATCPGGLQDPVAEVRAM